MTKSYQYTCRAEWSGCLDLIRVAAVMMEWATAQTEHHIYIIEIKAGADVFDCAEMTFGSDLGLVEIHGLLDDIMTDEKTPDCHRVTQTLNYRQNYTGEVVSR